MGCVAPNGCTSSLETLTINNMDLLKAKTPRSNRVEIHIELNSLSKEESSELPQALKRFFKYQHKKIVGLSLQTTSVDLNALCSIKQLMILRLEEANFDQIPEPVFTLNELRSLSLAKNKIKTIPSSLQALKKLENLDFSENLVECVDPLPYEKLEKLKGLVFAQNRITKLTACLNKPSLVNYIDFSYNLLSSLPPACFQIRSENKLQLFLQGNPLEELPDTIVNVTNLTVLDVSDTLLSCLPQGFENFASLEALALPLDSIRFPPKQVASQPYSKIKEYLLKERDSKVSSWEEMTASKLDDLYSVKIDNTEFSDEAAPYLYDLHSVLEQCSNLEILELRGCNLAIIPYYLPVTLSKLVLSYNKISGFSSNLRFVKGLKTLDLSQNCIQLVDHDLRQCSSLGVLDLSGNHIHKISDSAFDALLHLTDLNLSSNFLVSSTFSLGSQSELLRLNLCNNQIQQIPDNFFEACSKLKMLLISWNKLKALPSSLSTLENLEIFENYATTKSSGSLPCELEDLKEWSLSIKMMQKISERSTPVKTPEVKKNSLRTISIIAEEYEESSQAYVETGPTDGISATPRPKILRGSAVIEKTIQEAFDPSIRGTMKKLKLQAFDPSLKIGFKRLCFEECEPYKVQRALTSYKNFIEFFLRCRSIGNKVYRDRFVRTSCYGRNVFEYHALLQVMKSIGFNVEMEGRDAYIVTLQFSRDRANRLHYTQVCERIRTQVIAINQLTQILTREMAKQSLNKAYCKVTLMERVKRVRRMGLPHAPCLPFQKAQAKPEPIEDHNASSTANCSSSSDFLQPPKLLHSREASSSSLIDKVDLEQILGYAYRTPASRSNSFLLKLRVKSDPHCFIESSHATQKSPKKSKSRKFLGRTLRKGRSSMKVQNPKVSRLALKFLIQVLQA